MHLGQNACPVGGTRYVQVGLPKAAVGALLRRVKGIFPSKGWPFWQRAIGDMMWVFHFYRRNFRPPKIDSLSNPRSSQWPRRIGRAREGGGVSPLLSGCGSSYPVAQLDPRPGTVRIFPYMRCKTMKDSPRETTLESHGRYSADKGWKKIKRCVKNKSHIPAVSIDQTALLYDS